VLQDALAALPGIDSICPGRIVGVEHDSDRVLATIDEGGQARTVSGSLLVAADGARSSVREMLGIGASHVDYGQRAIIGNLLPERPHGNHAYERFTETGALALLPVSEERVAFVWILPHAEADALVESRDDEFTARLQDAFGWRLGRFSRVGVRASYPLALSKASRLTAQRAVLVGNAAHGLHPVAAQGFNLGLRDVAALCDCIADRVADGCADVGDALLLERYADWRRDDQRKLVGFTDGLVRLFGDRRRSVSVLRDLGMLGFDLLPGVRRLFARHTMGLAGRLPRLSRGVPLG